MKKNYSKPTVFVVELQRLCSVPVTSVDGNTGMKSPKSDAGYKGGGRSREARFSVDEWDEE